MIPNSIKKKVTLGVVALFIAFALKYHYSTASVNDLRWVLAPTAFLVETVTGVDFRFESYSGYLSEDRTFLIAASCSGANFLIIAFLMLNACALFRRELNWHTLPLAFLGAYATTILANTARIAIALETRGTGLDPEELHRAEGIVIYFGFLILLLFVSESFGERNESRYLMRLFPIPLAIYYICTLGIPLATGAYEQASFRAHSVFVLVIPLLIVALIAALAFVKRNISRKLRHP